MKPTLIVVRAPGLDGAKRTIVETAEAKPRHFRRSSPLIDLALTLSVDLSEREESILAFTWIQTPSAAPPKSAPAPQRRLVHASFRQ